MNLCVFHISIGSCFPLIVFTPMGKWENPNQVTIFRVSVVSPFGNTGVRCSLAGNFHKHEKKMIHRKVVQQYSSCRAMKILTATGVKFIHAHRRITSAITIKKKIQNCQPERTTTTTATTANKAQQTAWCLVVVCA